jgi:Neuraminidase (sialidase)
MAAKQIIIRKDLSSHASIVKSDSELSAFWDEKPRRRKMKKEKVTEQAEDGRRHHEHEEREADQDDEGS